MTTNAPPSRNPADDDSMAGMFNLVLRKLMQNVDDMLPAIVVSHDRVENRVRVKPLIAKVDTNNTVIPRGEIASVPVLNLGGGGFFVNFNLPAGSLGWIKANDRDISLFLQSYSEQQPNTLRTHNFSDSLFIPDVMTGYTIDDEDAQAMVIQNLDGSVRISLDATRIKMTSPQIETVSTGDFLINADNMTITLNSDLTVTSNECDFNGATVDNAGAIESPVSVTTPSAIVNSKELAEHDHTGGTLPTGNTGPNNP